MEPLSGLTNTELTPNMCSSDASDDATYSMNTYNSVLGLFVSKRVVSCSWLFSSSQLQRLKSN